MGNSARKEKRLTRAGMRLFTTSERPGRIMLRPKPCVTTSLALLFQLHSIFTCTTFGQFEAFRTRKERVVDSLVTPLPTTRLLSLLYDADPCGGTEAKEKPTAPVCDAYSVSDSNFEFIS